MVKNLVLSLVLGATLPVSALPAPFGARGAAQEPRTVSVAPGDRASASRAALTAAALTAAAGASSSASDRATVDEVGVRVPLDASATARRTARTAVPPSVRGAAPDQGGRSAGSSPVAHTVEGGWVLTDVLATGGFQMVGATWPHGQDVTGLDLRVRTRDSRGIWSAWQPLGPGDDGPDAGTADARHAQRAGTDALWVGQSDAVQLAVAGTRPAPTDLRLALVDAPPAPPVTTTNSVATGGAQVVTAAYLPTATDAPQVITRAQWGARPPACTPDVATSLVGAVLHHTAGSNAYTTVAQAEQQIRGDQAYHIDGQGWCDLGYNFVVDKWGNIYEGRVDSMTQPVVGAHAAGFNTGTVGVAMLGTYDAPPPAAVVRSVAKIIAWRLGYYGVNPQSTMSYHTVDGNSKVPADTTLTLPRVFGHRDVGFTACPGNGGYAALPSIRSQAAAYSYDTRFAQARSVVQAMYEDILGRGVDPSGLMTWSSMLVGGSSPASLVASLTSSAEYIRARITQAYQQTLGRDPDPGGMDSWYRAIRARAATVDDVERRFLSSNEFWTKSGGTDAGYVTRLYETVLGRRPAPSDVDFWTARIAAHGRDSMADGIWFSLEAAKIRAGVYYRTYLKREPDAAGLLTWAKVLLARGEGAVRIGIAGSEEYRAKALVRYPPA